MSAEESRYQTFSEEKKRVLGTCVTEWINDGKLSLTDVCKLLNLDIEKDKRNKLFWNVDRNRQVVIDEDVLNWCGYAGQYFHMKQTFKNLLLKNVNIEYTEVTDEQDPRRSFYVVKTVDFESLLMQMRSSKACEIRELFSLMKYIFIKYLEYEACYEKRNNELLTLENDEKIKTLQLTFEKEIVECKAEQLKAEKERAIAEEQKRQIFQHVLDQGERIDASNRTLESLKRRVIPMRSSSRKTNCFGVYVLKEGYMWYIIRCQRASYEKAERNLFKKHPYARLVNNWDDVPHAISLGNELKQCNAGLVGMGNVLCSNEEGKQIVSSDMIKEYVDKFLAVPELDRVIEGNATVAKRMRLA